MRTKIYNVGAYGIPADLLVDLCQMRPVPLTYSRHSLTEALNDRYGVLESRHFPTVFNSGDGWQVVEVESFVPGKVDKFVVRKEVDARRSLVLVIDRTGTVRTLWTNLNSDGHSTLNKERFDKP